MISELFFARERGGFWHELLPMEEKFVRELNMFGTKQFTRRARALVSRFDRDFVNELAFRIFQATASKRNVLAIRSLERTKLRIVVDETYAYIQRFRSNSKRPSEPLSITPKHVTEAQLIAQRLRKCFQTEMFLGSIVFNPEFRGCGIVDEATGDIYTDGTLFEVKAGDRSFRATDVRQLLTYSALNHASEQYSIVRLGLVNPRYGTQAIFKLEDCCLQMAGESAPDVLAAIVHELSRVEVSV
jgi:hypothetical protein